MWAAFKDNWANYLIEAFALGAFMVSATFFASVLGLPGWPGAGLESPLLRRVLMGFAMGLTAVILIYSPWGRRSGAHMNPAVTISFWMLGKIRGQDAFWYMVFQCVGGALAMGLIKATFPAFIGAPQVDYVQTLPGIAGVPGALLAEALISFGLLLTVLYASNGEKTAPYTGFFAGALVMAYIIVEAPFSGMSMNPARSLASALAAGQFQHLWIYWIAPPAGMLAAGLVWKKWICTRAEFKCSLQG